MKAPKNNEVEKWEHQSHHWHDEATEKLLQFNAVMRSYIKTALIGAALAAFLVWVSMELKFQDAILHPFTALVWAGATYWTHRMRNARFKI